MRSILLFAALLCLYTVSTAQHAENPVPYFSTSKGLGIIPRDSSFSINFRFRIQNRAGYTTISDKDLSVKEWEMVVRRLRLRMDGFVYLPQFTYTLQLSFSRGDMDWDVTGFPNVIRDAMLFYKANKHFTIGFGQTKLPGNRQRIISSGEQAFVDRSVVNATLNIDRDFGVQVYYDNKIGTLPYNLRGAISSGEGRNVTNSDYGLMYSSRAEIYPLGKFTNGGDYSEGDFERERSPKLAIAGFYAYNDHALRAGGTLGRPLFENRSFANYGGDILVKFKGWAAASELIRRESPDAVTVSADGLSRRYVYTGYGSNSDLTYLFKNNIMAGGRYSLLVPEGAVRAYEKRQEVFALTFGKFFKEHKLKLQSDFSYITFPGAPSGNHLQARLQFQLGI